MAERGRFSSLFKPNVAAVTTAIALMNSACLFAWWGLNSWVPAYLRFSPAQGGVGLSSSTMSLFMIAMQVGMWFGYVTFGFVADAIGRKRTYVFYVLGAAVLLPLYGVIRTPILLLMLGPFVAFFGTGYFSGLGAVVAEIYPTAIRATAAGFCYNFGRIASAAAPVHDRPARRDERLRSRLHRHRRGVPPRRTRVDLDPRDPQPRTDLSRDQEKIRTGD